MVRPLQHAPASNIREAAGVTEECDAATDPAAIDPVTVDPAAAVVDPEAVAALAAGLTIRGTIMDEQPTGQRITDASSLNSNDDGPAPFPPYSEQSETEAPKQGVDEQEAGDAQPISITEAALISPPSDPPSVAEPPQPVAEPEPSAEPIEPTEPTEPTKPTEPTELTEPTEPTKPTDPIESSEAQPDTPSPTAASPPRPAIPPPYWTHSHGQTTDTVPSPATAAVTTAATASRPPATHSHSTTSALSTTAVAASSTPSSFSPVPTTGGGAGAGYSPSHPHHRSTSSSSSLLHFNLITLQDNEALEQVDHSSCCANGAADATGTSSSIPSGDLLRALDQQHRQQRCWARRVELTDYVVIQGGSGGGSFGGSGGISGGPVAPRLGAFVVWTVRVETLEGTAFSIHKRYSEFDALRRQLVASFPQATASGSSGGGVTSLFGRRRPQPSSSRPSTSSNSNRHHGFDADHAGSNSKNKTSRSRSQSQSRKGARPTALPPLPPKTVLGNFRPAFLEQRRLGLQYFLNCILLNPEFAGSPILREFLFS